ncbi:MAG: lysine--tRNA ligase [Candidatus Cloacimonadota bacterium]|nr:MAG: lysine--tRNA ligase [Candidatus Cloacimonadota bacterium]PIE78076.1 MAG: lysine--tRNA ligase [Candidatus Delongbacteria bacterium]
MKNFNEFITEVSKNGFESFVEEISSLSFKAFVNTYKFSSFEDFTSQEGKRRFKQILNENKKLKLSELIESKEIKNFEDFEEFFLGDKEVKIEDTDRLIKVRVEKMKEIRDEMGVNPYPYNFNVTHYSKGIKSNFDSLNTLETSVSIAGRIMALRQMGKASFCTIQDKDGKIQLYVAEKNIGTESYAVFKKLDIGDIIGGTGIVKKTKVGEITVYLDSMTLLTKAIRPLPIVKEKDGEVFDAFNDKELKYRNRHIDLIVSPKTKETFKKRLKIIKFIKNLLDNKDFFEVETPTLVPIYGGGNAKPFISHHNSLDMKLYMRIALEIYLKKLIVGGFDRVYEIGKVFRNEGVDKTHNPEFTLLELYQAYGDYNDMMSITEEIFEQSSIAVNGTTEIKFKGKDISLKTPFKRMKMVDAIKEYGNLDVLNMSDSELEEAVKAKGGELKGGFNWGKAIEEIFELYAEEHIIQPTFIIQHPKESTGLCKVEYDDPRFLQRFELFINGTEYANAYSESNDPIFQRETLYTQSLRRKVDEEAAPMDEGFVQAIEVGMPPTGGLGIGIDRLVMLLTGEEYIRDVLFFPTMKPDDNK